jgi:hypothetical protein
MADRLFPTLAIMERVLHVGLAGEKPDFAGDHVFDLDPI